MAFLAPIGYALGVGTAATATTAATGVLAASLVGGAVLASVGMGIAGAVTGGRDSTPNLAPMPKAPSEAQARAEAEKEARQRASRRTKTILTDLGDENLLAEGKTEGKTLLGQ